MIEIGLPLREQHQKSCINAVYSYFAPRWGSFGEDGFTKIPNSMKGLRPSLSRKNKFLGGLYELDLNTTWDLETDEKWNVALKQRIGRAARFVTKSNSPLAVKITECLNQHQKLIRTLDQLDLVEVKVFQNGSKVVLKVTPMGGGICFLVVPPVRYNVPLPVDQLNKLSWSIEQLGNTISRILAI